MNLYTREIMAKLKCDAELAIKIQDIMGTFLDFSECTTREFNRAIKDAVLILEARKS
jgi:hypothetical protein